MIDDVHYLNSSDWVESLTAIVEHFDGRYELVDFASFVRAYPRPVDDHANESVESADSIPPIPANMATAHE